MSGLSADLLDLLAEKAPKLRQAGVTCFEAEGVRVELAAPDIEPGGASEEEEESYPDPFEDPALYRGRVPRLRRPDSE